MQTYAHNDTFLIGDFGGTNGRLALSTAEGIAHIRVYQTSAYSDPDSVIRDYCAHAGFTPDKGVIAIAGDSTNPAGVVFTNGAWAQKPVDFTTAVPVQTINDFAAVCYAVAELTPQDYKIVIKGTDEPFLPSAVLKQEQAFPPAKVLNAPPQQRFVAIGPGTGLGVGSGFVTSSGQFLVAGGEAGHALFAPVTQREMQIATVIAQGLEDGKSVTQETVCCGAGLVRAFNAISALDGLNVSIQSPEQLPQILNDPHAEVAKKKAVYETYGLFSATLGRSAASAALTNNARTVFLAGGILPKLGNDFDLVAFADGLKTNDLGQNNFLQDATSVALITHDQPGLLGAHAVARLG